MAKPPIPVEEGQQDGPDMRRCSRCGKTLRTPEGASKHIMAVHKGKGFRVRADDRDDEEESLADIAVRAEIKRLSGEPLDPLEKSLLP